MTPYMMRMTAFAFAPAAIATEMTVQIAKFWSALAAGRADEASDAAISSDTAPSVPASEAELSMPTPTAMTAAVDVIAAETADPVADLAEDVTKMVDAATEATPGRATLPEASKPQ